MFYIVRGGRVRWTVWLLAVGLSALVAMTPQSEAAPPKSEPVLKVVGISGKAVEWTAAEFRKLPRTVVEVQGREGQAATYAGVSLEHVLSRAGVPQGEKLRDEWLRAIVVIEATDGYRVVFALAECDSAFTDRTILVADEINGRPLDDGHGPWRVIVPGEKRHARWIRMVKEIRVLDSLHAEVPED
jgi:hypothetical protein